MKRNLLLAISVLALTAVSQPTFAAESDTPAPRDAAPAAERQRAPASARQTRQAPARQAPQRAPSQQASTSSFTGSQAGGFGGGNAGGGGFADPTQFCQLGFNPPVLGLQTPCQPIPVNGGSSNKFSATGGATIGHSIPVQTALGTIVVGVLGEVAAGRISTTVNQTNTVPTSAPFGPDPLGRQTTQSVTSTFNQGTNGSIMLKLGVPVNIPTMTGWNTTVLLYGLVGSTFARVDGTYTYAATNCSTIGSPLCSTGYGALNWSQTRTGVTGGFGVEWMYIPGVTFKIEYRYTSLGSISQDVPLAVTSLSTGLPCSGSTCAGSSHIDISNLHFNTIRFGVGFGL